MSEFFIPSASPKNPLEEDTSSPEDPEDSSEPFGYSEEDICLSPQNEDAENITRRLDDLGDGSEFIETTPRDFVLPPPSVPLPRDTFLSLAKWKGRVIERTGSTFRAVLEHVFDEGLQKEAEIDIEEVTPEDHELIKEGAVFYWSIGYLTRPSGRVRASIIRFRRLPVWSENDIMEARKRAEEYKHLLDDK